MRRTSGRRPGTWNFGADFLRIAWRWAENWFRGQNFVSRDKHVASVTPPLAATDITNTATVTATTTTSTPTTTNTTNYYYHHHHYHHHHHHHHHHHYYYYYYYYYWLEPPSGCRPHYAAA